MIDLLSLIKSTTAYKTIQIEKKEGKLSHAYLITTADEYFLEDIAKIFASLIACEKIEPCMNCRACSLIKDKIHPDVIFYPKGEKDVVVEDIQNLIEESVIKPLEEDKKVFVILRADKMNARAQNKLLKTLEEPPKNVHILLFANSDYPLLSTVKSRVKKFEMGGFSDEKLFEALKDECADAQKLAFSIKCADGTLGKTRAYYFDDNLRECALAVEKVLCDMKSSAELLEYSNLVSSLKCGIEEFLSVLELSVRDMLIFKQNENLIKQKDSRLFLAEGYNTGALIYILEKIVEAKRRKKQNANAQMLIEWLLFQILEGKFKWRKS